MKKRWPLFMRVLAAVFLLTTAAPAQNTVPVQSQILVLDSDRAYLSSVAGQLINNELEIRLAGLVAENRAIEAELEAEELELTEKRATTELTEFRAMADVFDKKVQKIRSEQDAKQQELLRLRDVDRKSFVESMSPIITQLAFERGALVILERRNVLLSAETVDITDEVINRINEKLGSEDEPTDLSPDENSQNQGED